VASLLAGAALLGIAPAHAASVSCFSDAGWGGSSPLNPGGTLQTGDACFSRSEPTNGGLLIAEADSDRGIVRGSALVEFPVGVSHTATASSSWREELWVINHPDPTKQGTSGSLRYAFFIQGFLDATGAGVANMILSIEGNRTTERNILNIGATSVTGPRAINEFIEGEIGFVFGETANFTFRLNTSAQRRPGVSGAGFAEALFINSGYWGGITSVSDADGPLTGVTFGGTNLNFESALTTSTIPAAVPLPASVWLLGTGVAGLLWRRRAKAAA
jgi:hypothetical protein